MEENKKEIINALRRKKIDVAVATNFLFIAPFMKFLCEKNIVKKFEEVTGGQLRKMLNNKFFLLVYIIKLIVGIPRIRGTEKLLNDKGAMKIIGFEDYILENGLCDRGKANQHSKSIKKRIH